jgi:hypothetical protein
MGVDHKTETLRTGDFTRLHTTSTRPLRVTIDKINGEPPSPASPLTELQGLKGGVIKTESRTVDISMTRAQCIPVGIVRGRLRGSGNLTANIEYTVRTGQDA